MQEEDGVGGGVEIISGWWLLAAAETVNSSMNAFCDRARCGSITQGQAVYKIYANTIAPYTRDGTTAKTKRKRNPPQIHAVIFHHDDHASSDRWNGVDCWSITGN